MASKKANKKQNNGKAARRIKRVARRATMVARGFVGLDPPAMKAAHMLIDPCNAALADSVMRGDQGYKARFSLAGGLLNAATTTSGAIAYIPGANIFYTIDWTVANAATAWANNTAVYAPGLNFLTLNASAIRSVGACLSLTPLATNLATSGVVHSGIVPVSALGIGSSWTPAPLATLCNNFGKITIDGPMETKYIPSAADEEYLAPNTIITGDVSDTSAILFVFVGFPAGTGFSVRVTNIVEWKPLASVGIVSTSSRGNPSKNNIEHVKQALFAKDDAWYTNVGKTAFSVLRGFASGGVAGAVTSAFKVFK